MGFLPIGINYWLKITNFIIFLYFNNYYFKQYLTLSIIINSQRLIYYNIQ